MSSNDLISRLSDHLSTHMGLHFPEKRWGELRKKMSAAMEVFDYKSEEEFIHWLLSAPLTQHQVELLACRLTVKETYFFRENQTFEALKKSILPELISMRRKTDTRLRIWSAGCSTGEEAYSIAILLTEVIPDIKDWNITILATDINPDALQRAKKGIFSEWSFRDIPSRIKSQYFDSLGNGHYAIRSPFKEMITFSYLNLSEDTYPLLSNNTNAMDLIFCRNVLMYFAPERVQKVLQRFRQALLDRSHLIVSVVEASPLLSAGFAPVRFTGTTLYRKDNNCANETRINPVPPLFSAEASAKPVDQSKPPRLSGRPRLKDTKATKLTAKTLTPYEEALDSYRKGLYEETERSLVGILSANPDSLQAIILLTRALANQGKLTDAFSWSEKAISADKLNPGLYYLRATVLEEQGKPQEAIASLTRALYLDPDFVLAHFSLSNLTKRLGRHDESRKHLRNTVELLSRYRPDEILPESGEITAGRLAEILRSTGTKEIAT